MTKNALPRGFARQRVMEAALGLFAEHGVKGTSLQMIADALGVRKASVYYQFHSKDEIVLAVVEPVFADMRRLITIGEAMQSEDARREMAVSGLVELAVRHRRIMAVFWHDPAVHALVRSIPDLAAVTDRTAALLTGPDPSTDMTVTVSMVASAICGTATQSSLRDVSDEDLHRILLRGAQQLIHSAIPAS